MTPSRRDAVQFTRESALRIAGVVRTVEVTPKPGKPLTFSAFFPAISRRAVRMGTFTGAWSKDASKTVTFRTTTSTPNTVTAINIFIDITTSVSATKNCAIAKDGTAWYLIAAECD